MMSSQTGSYPAEQLQKKKKKKRERERREKCTTENIMNSLPYSTFHFPWLEDLSCYHARVALFPLASLDCK